MNRRTRLRVGLLCYMAGDVFGMFYVGHLTLLGVGTFVVSAVLSLMLLALACLERTSTNRPR